MPDDVDDADFGIGTVWWQISQHSEITTICKHISMGLFESSPDLQRLASKRVQLALISRD